MAHWLVRALDKVSSASPKSVCFAATTASRIGMINQRFSRFGSMGLVYSALLIYYKHYLPNVGNPTLHGSNGIMIQHYEPLNIHERGKILCNQSTCIQESTYIYHGEYEWSIEWVQHRFDWFVFIATSMEFKTHDLHSAVLTYLTSSRVKWVQERIKIPPDIS